MGGPEDGYFPLLYVVKMSYIGGWVVQKSLKTPLRNIKMAPYAICNNLNMAQCSIYSGMQNLKA